MSAGGDDLAIQLDDQRLRDRRAADSHELPVFHADAVIDQHVGQFFQSCDRAWLAILCRTLHDFHQCVRSPHSQSTLVKFNGGFMKLLKLVIYAAFGYLVYELVHGVG